MVSPGEALSSTDRAKPNTLRVRVSVGANGSLLFAQDSFGAGSLSDFGGAIPAHIQFGTISGLLALSAATRCRPMLHRVIDARQEPANSRASPPWGG